MSMTQDDPSDWVDECAADWVVRLDRLHIEPHESADLQAWLGQDVRRQGAFLRAQAAWARLDGLGAPGAVAVPARHGLRHRPDRRAFWAGGMAAGAALALGGGALLRRDSRLTTTVGEVRRVPLQDGSVATINTDSALSLGFEPQTRRIALGKGEAWFQVAKDSARPFVVEAGLVRVMAVGTAFSVRRRNGAEEVIVTEGVVQAWRADVPGRRLTLRAGERARIASQGAPWTRVEQKAALEQSLAWREGEIVLSGQPLAQAVAEFNRYNEVKLAVDDPALADQTLVGRFDANDPEGFAQAVGIALRTPVVQVEGSIRLGRAGG